MMEDQVRQNQIRVQTIIYDQLSSPVSNQTIHQTGRINHHRYLDMFRDYSPNMIGARDLIEQQLRVN